MSNYSDLIADDVTYNMIMDSHPCRHSDGTYSHSYENGICEDCGDEDWDYEAPATDDLLSDHEDAMDELRTDGA